MAVRHRRTTSRQKTTAPRKISQKDDVTLCVGDILMLEDSKADRRLFRDGLSVEVGINWGAGVAERRAVEGWEATRCI